MIDRIFAAALTFCLLIGGTLAIGSAMLGMDQHKAATVRTVQLERVVVTAKRLPAATVRLARNDETAQAARLQ